MADKRLLFLHTGGTLGMTSAAPGPLAPGHYDRTVLPYVRGLEDIAEIEGEVVCNLDSTDMTPSIWERMALLIEERHNDFDGFVVLHGTDTLAYTAAALSFSLQGLGKPVVITGSQRPVSALRTDGRTNLVHAAICASGGGGPRHESSGTVPSIPEVSVFFGKHLFRGNRVTKVSIQSFDAFASPNFPPLLTMGVDIQKEAAPLVWPHGLRTTHGFATDVAILTLYPGMPADILPRAARGARAVVLLGFGEGNVPKQGWPERIREVTDKGVAVIVLSQCRAGAVIPGRYEGSSAARDAGAGFGGELTGEAAVVKAMWLLNQGIEGRALCDALLRPVAGECAPLTT